MVIWTFFLSTSILAQLPLTVPKRFGYFHGGTISQSRRPPSRDSYVFFGVFTDGLFLKGRNSGEERGVVVGTFPVRGDLPLSELEVLFKH